MKLNRFLGICLLGSLLTFVSCGQKEAYYKFYELNSGQWSKEDTLKFTIDSSLIDITKRYQITLEVVNTADYAYQNIWFFLEDNIKDSTLVAYNKQYMLADNFGNWLGAGFGSLYQLPLVYKDSVEFTEKRNIEIKVVHGMRDEPLKGIDKIGIKIEEIE